MNESSQLNPPATEHDHTQGPPRAPVTLVEYGDYECPYCGQAFPLLREIRRQMGEKLRFVFRNFPLNSIHPNAELAAEAAEAAGAQGKFWEMHDALYENQERLSADTIFALADEIGLDMATFTADLEAGKFRARVRADFTGGVRSGVNGTPSFFINGTRFDGAWNGEGFLEALNTAAAAAKAGRKRIAS